MALFRQAATLGVGQAIQSLSAIVVLMVTARALEVGEYGRYRQFFLICELAIPLLGVGLSQTIYYFLSRVRQKQALLLRYLILAILVPSAGVWLLSKVGWWLDAGPFNVIPSSLLYLLILYVVGSVVLPISAALYIHAGETAVYVRASAIYAITSAALTSLVAFFGAGVEHVISARVIPLVVFSVTLTLAAKRCSVDSVREKDERPPLSEILSKSVPLGVASALGIASLYVDRVLVSLFENAEAYAVYVNGAHEIPLISVVTGSIATASLAHFSNILVNDKRHEAAEAFKSVIRITSTILVPAMFAFWIAAEPFMVFMFGSDYEKSADVFKIYLLLLPARTVFYGPLLVALGYGRVVLYRAGVEVVLNVLLSLILYKVVGLYGIAMATVAVTYLWSIPFNLVHIRRGLQVSVWRLVPVKALAARFATASAASPIAIYLAWTEKFSGFLGVLVLISSFGFPLLALYWFSGQVRLNGKKVVFL